MTEKPPIPPSIWARIVSFLKDERSGEIVIRVHKGRVTEANVTERVRDGDTVVPIEAPTVPPLKTR